MCLAYSLFMFWQFSVKVQSSSITTGWIAWIQTAEFEFDDCEPQSLWNLKLCGVRSHPVLQLCVCVCVISVPFNLTDLWLWEEVAWRVLFRSVESVFSAHAKRKYGSICLHLSHLVTQKKAGVHQGTLHLTRLPSSFTPLLLPSNLLVPLLSPRQLRREQ